jgi:hypothetical protein
MTINLDIFVSELENYEFGVKHIIPTTSETLVDDGNAFTDELDNILDARTYLEKMIRLYPREPHILAHLPRLRVADSILRAKQDTVLKLVPNFAQGRRHLKQTPPESYWWWYLDTPVMAETEEQIIYVTQNRLGLTFTEAIVAGVGLRAGQSVKVTAADSKHILISLQE